MYLATYVAIYVAITITYLLYKTKYDVHTYLSQHFSHTYVDGSKSNMQEKLRYKEGRLQKGLYQYIRT